MAGASWRLTYESSASPALAGRIDPALCKRFGCEGEIRCVATLSGDGLLLERGEMQRAVWDLRDGRRLFVDRLSKEHLFAENARRDETRTPEPVTPTLSGPLARRPARIGDEACELVRYDLPIGKLPAEIWVRLGKFGAAPALRAFWELLVPGGAALADQGVPADILVRDPENPTEIIARLRLIAIERDKAQSLPMEPPRGSRDISGDAAKQSRAGKYPPDKRGRQTAAELLRAAKIDTVRRALDTRALSASGQDIAWVTDQRVLDLLRDVINGFAAGIAGFQAQGRQEPTSGGVIGNVPPEPVKLHLDWWEQVQPHLRFGPDGADTAETLRCVRRILLALSASSGSTITGLTAADEANYNRSISLDPMNNPYVLLLGPEPARVLNVFAGAHLNDAAIDRIAQARFDEIAAARNVELPLTEIREILDGNVIELRAYNLRLIIDVDNAPVIESLTWEDGRIRAIFTIRSIGVGFRFSTRLASTSEATHCAIWTFGICALIATNDGDGVLVADQPRIAVNITPLRRYDNTTRLEAELDREASSLNYLISLLGWNPVQDILLLVYSALDSAFGQWLTGRILDPLATELSNLLDDVEAFHWPAGLWHATSGPPLRGLPAHFTAGVGRWEADLATRYGLWPGTVADIDSALANPAAYVLSRPYLTAWLREIVGPITGETRSGTEFADQLGVALEDPRLLDPDRDRTPRDPFAGPFFESGEEFARRLAGLVENCERPPTLGPQHAYRAVLQRRAPVVVFPAQGSTSDSGIAEMRYTFEFAAARYDLVHVPTVIPHEECIDVRRPVPDGPILSGRITGKLDLRALADGRVGHRAIPEGLTPGRLAEREEAVLRVRERWGASETGITPGFLPGEGDIVVRPGRPIGPPPGEPPGDGVGGFTPFPEPPDLPEVICEPPHCEWTSFVDEEVVAPLVRAEIVVRSPLLLGFNLDLAAALWLPEIRLGRATPDLAVEFAASVELSGPFAAINRQAVEDRIISICRDDATALLEPLGQFVPSPFDADDLTQSARPLSTVRPLLSPLPIDIVFGNEPSFPQVNAHLTGLVTYQQPGGQTDPTYGVAGELLTWPVEIAQHLTSIIVP